MCFMYTTGLKWKHRTNKQLEVLKEVFFKIFELPKQKVHPNTVAEVPTNVLYLEAAFFSPSVHFILNQLDGV